MSTLQKLIGAILRPGVRRKARGRSLEELAQRLDASGTRVGARIIQAHDTAGNREAINHIVGIERWGQQRLRVALGAPLQLDGYRGYRLPDGAELADLQAAFTSTRAETVALARELNRAGVDAASAVRHDDLGELTVTEWLAYLDDHARRESFRIRGGIASIGQNSG